VVAGLGSPALYLSSSRCKDVQASLSPRRSYSDSIYCVSWGPVFPVGSNSGMNWRQRLNFSWRKDEFRPKNTM